MLGKTLLTVLLFLSVDNSFQQDFTKFLVATGRKGTLKSVEVVSLDEPAKTCENLPELPRALKGPTGQLFNKTLPVICGGIEIEGKDLCECYALVQGENPGEGEWITHSSPKDCGTYSRSVLLNSGDKSGDEERNDLWLVTGGLVANNPVFRTDAYDGEGWKQNAVKNLPVGVYLHCLVRLNDTILMMIGGTTEKEHATKMTFAYDNSDDTWTRGPSLTEARSGHACGVINHVNAAGEEEKVVVVAGGSTGADYAKTVELLRINSLGAFADAWEEGPKLPKNILFGTMVEYQDSVILVGGGGEEIKPPVSIDKVSFDGDELYQLKGPDSEWKLLPQKLKEPRSQLSAFFIPDEFAKCE